MKLTALALAILALGVVLGLGLNSTVFEAEAKPPPPGPQAVEEQNVDASGFIAVHEQGVADVNVVSMPSLDPGPQEFTHFTVSVNPNGTVRDPSTSELFDIDATLIGLSAQQWELVGIDTLPYPASSTIVIYTLSRPAP